MSVRVRKENFGVFLGRDLRIVVFKISEDHRYLVLFIIDFIIANLSGIDHVVFPFTNKRFSVLCFKFFGDWLKFSMDFLNSQV